MQSLRQQIIRLAHEKPKLRKSLLPLIRLAFQVLSEEASLGRKIAASITAYLAHQWRVEIKASFPIALAASAAFTENSPKKAVEPFLPLLPALRAHFASLGRGPGSPVRRHGLTSRPTAPQAAAQLGANVVHLLGSLLEQEGSLDSYRDHHNEVYPESEIAAFVEEYLDSSTGKQELVRHWTAVLNEILKQLGIAEPARR